MFIPILILMKIFKGARALIVFGIDPGVSGAISVFENKKIITFFDMPTMIEGKKIKDK